MDKNTDIEAKENEYGKVYKVAGPRNNILYLFSRYCRKYGWC